MWSDLGFPTLTLVLINNDCVKMHFSGENMIYLINTFNPHWEGHALPEWTWPKRRVFGYMLKLMDGPLSLGIGGLRRIGMMCFFV
jgi:hypothetical protein